MTDTIKCSNCGYDQLSSKIDTNNTKQVFQGTDMSWGYFDVYSTFGLCRRCNEYGLLIKVDKKQSGMANEMRKSSKVQEMIQRLSKK